MEAGNYIERVFPFLDVRYIAITDDFDTARPGTDLSVPLKNIVNEYYSKDLSKKVETGKHSIWAQEVSVKEPRHMAITEPRMVRENF